MKTLIPFLVFSLLAVAQQTQQERIVKCVDAGSTDDYACTPTPAVTSYTTGLRVRLYPATSNTGAATVNLSALGAKSIKRADGTDPANTDLRATKYFDLVYDGTNMQMLSQLGNVSAGGGISTAELTASGPGWWWLWGVPQGFQNNGANTALRTYIVAFTLPIKASFADIMYRIHTGAGTPTLKVITFGVYNSACDTLLGYANRVDLTAGYYSTPLNARLNLDAGVYYFALSTEDTTVQLSGQAQGVPFSSFSTLFNSARLPVFYGTASTQPGGANTTVILPATCGTRTASSSIGIPHIGLIP